MTRPASQGGGRALAVHPSSTLRFVKTILIGALFAGVSFLLRERWGRSASLWFLGVSLTLWLLLWLVNNHLEKRLRDRRIEVPGEDD